MSKKLTMIFFFCDTNGDMEKGYHTCFSCTDIQLTTSPLKVYPNTTPTPASILVIGAFSCNPGMAEDAHAHTALLMWTQHTM